MVCNLNIYFFNGDGGGEGVTSKYIPRYTAVVTRYAGYGGWGA